VSGLRKKKIDGKAQSMHLIDHPYRSEPSQPQYSAMADSKTVDFTRGPKRDDVSFYKHLAREGEARRLGLSVE
jgi:hypothetical protein